MQQPAGPPRGGRAATTPESRAPAPPAPAPIADDGPPAGWGSLWNAAVVVDEPPAAPARPWKALGVGALAGAASAFWAGAWAALVAVCVAAASYAIDRRAGRRAPDVEVISDAAEAALWCWSPDSRFLWLSRRWAPIFSVPSGEHEDLGPLLSVIHPQDRLGFEAELDRLRRGDTKELRLQVRIDAGDRGWRYSEGRAICKPDDRGRPRIAGSFTDVTDRRAAEDALTRTAYTDALTELPNRHGFLDYVGHALARARAAPRARFAVLLLDVDRFQVLNDSLGHAAGDALLVTIGERLRASVRPGDRVARLSGDDFAVLVAAGDSDDIWSVVASRIQEALRPVVVIAQQEWSISISIGVVRSSEGYNHAADLLRDAETAMYRAKKLPETRICVFDRGMHEAVVSRMRLDAELRRAIAQKELVLHYQPIVELASGHVQGFEALVRWSPPGKALIPPDSFIPIAEDTGLVVPLGQWVAEEATRQLAALRKADSRWEGLVMNINVSARQLREPDLVAQLRTSILAAGVPASAVKLELTESMMIESGSAARTAVEAMRAEGFRVAIDDFGTGYSSLAYLHRFPLDTLKIDKSFVRGLGGDDAAARIVRTIIDLARSLGVPVTAEGVETEVQLDALRRMGCDHAQGWYFGRPMPGDAVERFLQEKLGT